jgi:competence protein ComEA
MAFWERLWERIKEYRLFFILLLLTLVGGFYLFFSQSEEEILLHLDEGNEIWESTDKEQGNPNPAVQDVKKILVDVKGAIKSPGVYELDEGMRVNDAIRVAGGLNEDADVTRVNLAAFLADGQVVYIPTVNEEESVWLNLSNSGEDPKLANSQGNDSLVNVNTATIEELDALPGIGPSKAKAIIEYREEHGPFTDVKQLGEVSGIGEKTLEKLLPYIRVK